MPLAREVGLGPGDIMLDGDPVPPAQKGSTAAPYFSARVCCDQMARWIKMLLGMEVGLSPGHIVIGGDPPPPPKKGHKAPIFGPCLLWSNGFMDQHATWYRCRPRPRRHCVTWGPSRFRNFWSMSVVPNR